MFQSCALACPIEGCGWTPSAAQSGAFRVKTEHPDLADPAAAFIEAHSSRPTPTFVAATCPIHGPYRNAFLVEELGQGIRGEEGPGRKRAVVVTVGPQPGDADWAVPGGETAVRVRDRYAPALLNQPGRLFREAVK